MEKQILILMASLCRFCLSANILMVTMGGTKSHKIPFWELAKGLIPRGHNVTFINAFPADFALSGLEEITPANLVFYVKNFTDWDLIGAKIRGEEPVHPVDIFRYGYEACEALLEDGETKELLRTRQHFDLAILDGAYPECALGFTHHFRVPFMYINTVGFYTGSLSLAGNPSLYSVTPFFTRPFTDSMSLVQRTLNSINFLGAYAVHAILVRFKLNPILKRHFGTDIPHAYEMAKNVSFILQNGHASVTYPRPFLPNVAEVACIHCKHPRPLPSDLEEFINGSGDAGFIYVSMGSSVRTSNMPEYLKRLLLCVFRRLPQRVLWKWESSDEIPNLPANVMLGKWLPQQDVLGHPKLKAFVTHGGLLSMFETVYHGVPIVTLPVFCDHDSNAAKAELDGYAIKLDLSTITVETLLRAIKDVIYNPAYRLAVKKRQLLFRDQKEAPLERAVYWTEYVLRHNGATHLQSISKDLNFFQYYLIDVCVLSIVFTYVSWSLTKLLYLFLTGSISFSTLRNKTVKID